MHNCKAMSETLVALALDEAQSDQTQPLPAEVANCAACLQEYASLLNVVRVAEQVKESALPGNDFWPGYQARLRQSLTNGAASRISARPLGSHSGLSVLLRNLFTSSVRIPVPLAAGASSLLIFVGVSFAFALNSRRQVRTPAPIVITKTVEVPVAQEKPVDKIVTRIVYRDRDRRRPLNGGNAIAARPRTSASEIPINLIGFKPANEINLTIIKGSQR
jgi:hypothetical protein